MSGINAPDRRELYELDDGEKPVEIYEDTKIPNAITVKVVKQDHTLANMLRAQLLSMPAVLFAGYKVPHPLHPYFLLKVQTDGSLTAQAAVESAAANLMLMLRDLETSFKAEFAAKAVDAPAGAPGAPADEPYGTGAGSAWGMGGDYMDM